MILSAEHIDQPCSGMYTERIYDVTSPNGVILLTDGYSIDIITKCKDGEIENMPLTYIPVNPDNLKFEEWDNNVLKISCCEFYNWENEIELYLDCDSMV